METLVAYSFSSKELLALALTHSSYSNEQAVTGPRAAAPDAPADNERLEFLGDAVIGLVVAQLLMDRFPQACEGKLSRWRSNLVSRKTLAEIAADLDIGGCLLLGRGEKRTGGAEKRSILAAGLEAIVGALYLDGGMPPVWAFLSKIYATWLESLGDGDDTMLRMLDKKTHLQEKTQSLYKTTPVYRLVEVWGLEHEKNFKVEILIADKVIATGSGRSKKEAEQAAAHQALETLGF